MDTQPLWDQIIPSFYGEGYASIKGSETEWLFDIDDRDTIRRARGHVEQAIPKDLHPPFERLAIDDVSDSDSEEFFVFDVIGDDASNAEKTHHADSTRKCEQCGNEYQDPAFVPVFDDRRIPKKSILVSFYGDLKILCRPSFVDLYAESGLTGLSFQRAEASRDANPLHHVAVAQHSWIDKAGVCDTCGMKTNVMAPAFFNLDETYRYDIQYVLLYDTCQFVLSSKAIRFLDQHTEIGQSMEFAAAPIKPGYRQDTIYPEDRLFRAGTWPTKVLKT